MIVAETSLLNWWLFIPLSSFLSSSFVISSRRPLIAHHWSEKVCVLVILTSLRSCRVIKAIFTDGLSFVLGVTSFVSSTSVFCRLTISHPAGTISPRDCATDYGYRLFDVPEVSHSFRHSNNDIRDHEWLTAFFSRSQTRTSALATCAVVLDRMNTFVHCTCTHVRRYTCALAFGTIVSRVSRMVLSCDSVNIASTPALAILPRRFADRTVGSICAAFAMIVRTWLVNRSIDPKAPPVLFIRRRACTYVHQSYALFVCNWLTACWLVHCMSITHPPNAHLPVADALALTHGRVIPQQCKCARVPRFRWCRSYPTQVSSVYACPISLAICRACARNHRKITKALHARNPPPWWHMCMFWLAIHIGRRDTWRVVTVLQARQHQYSPSVFMLIQFLDAHFWERSASLFWLACWHGTCWFGCRVAWLGPIDLAVEVMWQPAYRSAL